MTMIQKLKDYFTKSGQQTCICNSIETEQEHESASVVEKTLSPLDKLKMDLFYMKILLRPDASIHKAAIHLTNLIESAYEYIESKSG